MKRKREAIEAEPDPVAEIQKHLNMVEEDKCKLQTHLKEKRAYSDKLNHLVSIHELNYEIDWEFTGPLGLEALSLVSTVREIKNKSFGPFDCV